jgi:hypothetical protein
MTWLIVIRVDMGELGQVSRNDSWSKLLIGSGELLRRAMAIWEPLAQIDQALIWYSGLTAYRIKGGSHPVLRKLQCVCVYLENEVLDFVRPITVSHADLNPVVARLLSLHGIGLMRMGPLHLQIDATCRAVGPGHPHPLTCVALAAARDAYIALRPIHHMHTTGQEGPADERETLPYRSLH